MTQPIRRAVARVTGEVVTFPWTARAAGATSAPMADVTEIDARDLLCPLPVLRLTQALRGVSPGTEVHLLATDPAAAVDVPHFCAEQGVTYLGSEDVPDGVTRYRVRTT